MAAPASATVLAHSNSYTHIKGAPVDDRASAAGKGAAAAAAAASATAPHAQLTLGLQATRRALRSTAAYDQGRAPADSRPPPYSWPCTSLCIIPAVSAAPVHVPASASASSSAAVPVPVPVPYDLLLLGTHVHPSRRPTTAASARKCCLYVAILPHVPPSSVKDMPPQTHPLFRAPSLRSRHGAHAAGTGPAAGGGAHAHSVRVVPSYGVFPTPPPSLLESATQSLRRGARKLCGRRRRRHDGYRQRSNPCTQLMSSLWRAVRQPLRALSSLVSSPAPHDLSFAAASSLSPARLLRHYPRISSLAQHGVHLQEEPWPWAHEPSVSAFYGLELVWADSEAEWSAWEMAAKQREPARAASVDESPSMADAPSSVRRQLPIHPSHMCVDPASGEIIMTDHDQHAVYKLLPCWLMQQTLMHLAEPKPKLKQPTNTLARPARQHDSAMDDSNTLPASSSFCPASASSPSPLSDADAAAAAAEEGDADFVLPLPDVLIDLVVGYLGNQVRLLAGESTIKGCRDGAGTDAHFNAPNGVAVHPNTGTLFITDGHWNSRICSMQPQSVPRPLGAAPPPTTASSSASSSSSSSSSAALLPSPTPPRWTVATVPLHRWRSSTWWSAVKHSGVYQRAPALWPLRLPTAPVLLQGAGAGGAAASASASSSSSAAAASPSEYSSDALVLLDEELHILRHIPLASGSISTVSGQMGVQGARDGWGQSASFLFPQALISLPHPLGLLARTSGESASRTGAAVPTRPRAGGHLPMAQRQALLLADTGNDRLCLVNLVSRDELRMERRKQAMLRRQMRALRRQRRGAGSGSDTSGSDRGSDESDASSSSDEGDSSSSCDSDSDSESAALLRASNGSGAACCDDSGPLVGHVETIRVRGQLPEEYEQHFLRVPWSPWADMHAAARERREREEGGGEGCDSSGSAGQVALTLRQREEAAASASASVSASASASASVPSSSSSSSADADADAGASVARPLSALPFVHRGQNTFVRKLVVTSQGRILALNRLGVQCFRWAKDAHMEE